MIDAGTTPRPHGIRLIGAGLGRTGTKSLAAALDLLGYRTYHFPLPEHSAAWAAFAEGKGSAQEAITTAVDAEFDATCDQPMADVFKMQLAMFPNAKVVLTVRDNPMKWAQSWKVLMNFIEVQERPFSIFYPTFIQWLPFMRHWKRMRDIMGVPNMGLLPGQLIRGYKHEPEGWLETQYEVHNAEVQKCVPKDQLLVFNVKEGWGPLCTFLDKEIPDVPFPNVNESEELRRAALTMKVVSYGWIPFLVGVSYVSKYVIDSAMNSIAKLKTR